MSALSISFNIADNPVCNEDDFRTEVLVTLLGLDKLNKDEFADEEKIEALEIYRQRQAEVNFIEF